MKFKLFIFFCFNLLIADAQAIGSNSVKSSLKSWFSNSVGEHIDVSFNKQKIQFDGCKLKAYDLLITRAFGEHLSLDMSLGYATGRNSWGIFSQTVMVKNYQITPRWHFDQVSIGIGISIQQSHQLKTSHGPEINLPLQKQWSIEADLPALADNHHMRLSLVRQQWQANNLAFSSTNYTAQNTGFSVNYSVVF